MDIQLVQVGLRILNISAIEQRFEKMPLEHFLILLYLYSGGQTVLQGGIDDAFEPLVYIPGSRTFVYRIVGGILFGDVLQRLKHPLCK